VLFKPKSSDHLLHQEEKKINKMALIDLNQQLQ